MNPLVLPANPSVASDPVIVRSERDEPSSSELALQIDKPTLSSDLQQLTKARLTTFVLLTTAVGYGMAVAPGQPFLWMRFFHTILGTALVACCSSILNQFLERRTDALMVRTALRPFVTKRLPLIPSVVCGLILGVVGIWELDFFVNPLTAALGLVTLASYVLLYTPLKRVTELNTLVGAIPGALPPLMGSAASSGTCPAAGWSLFAIMAVWQLPHFYAIAYLYRDDYEKGGMRMLSTNDLSGTRTANHALFWTLVLIPASLLPIFFGRASIFYAPIALLLDLAFLMTALAFYRSPDKTTARRLFFCSIIWLPLILTFLVISSL